MKRDIKIYTLVLVVLAAAGISMGFQELRSAAAIEASRIFMKNCSLSGCHQGQYPPLGLNLGEAQFQDSLINVPSQEVPRLKLMDTQNPEQSYLLMKIKGSEGIVGKQMPANSPPMEPEEILAIESWVQSLEGSNTKGKAVPDINKVQTPAFWGTRVVNLPTPRSIDKGEVLFRVSHRFFPAVKEGYDAFYGLDGPASMLLGLGYGFSDKISLTLSRANVSKEFELALKWTLIDQSSTDGPISMALLGSASLVTLPLPGKKTFRSENTRINFQASLAYKVSPTVSLLLVPGYSTNTNPTEESFQGTLSLGLGGRVQIINDFSILLEWIPDLSGYSFESSGWGFGVEKRIGGHVFQVFVLNSVGITTPQFVPGGEFRISEGEFRIGFNIFRWF
jgi:hypothetical protein